VNIINNVEINRNKKEVKMSEKKKNKSKKRFFSSKYCDKEEERLTSELQTLKNIENKYGYKPQIIKPIIIKPIEGLEISKKNNSQRDNSKTKRINQENFKINNSIIKPIESKEIINPKNSQTFNNFQNSNNSLKNSLSENNLSVNSLSKENHKDYNEEFYRDFKQSEKYLPKFNEDKVEEGIEREIPNDSEIKWCAEKINKLKKEISKVIVGQEEVIDDLINALICESHALLEGVPGIAKTLIIRALAQASGCEVKRVQFTVDLLPTDIIGLTTYTPELGFKVEKGPIFTNFLIADEINRSPPKTHSALIEAMQERQVTIGKQSFKLPKPFFVMATKNPLESAGVYSLPEAQLDRFLFKIIVKYPKTEDEMKIMEKNIDIKAFENFGINPVITSEDIIKMQEIARRIYLDKNIKKFILDIVKKTRDKNQKFSEQISWGVSPRATIGLFIASKANALINGRNFVLPEDVKKVAYLVLRHRLILSYKAVLQKITSDDIIKEILDQIKVI